MAERKAIGLLMSETPESRAARHLVALYDRGFGGMARGRYRISIKHLRALLGRARIYPEDIVAVQREIYELGFVLIDMETFFIVLGQRTFANYRRVNDASIEAAIRDGGAADA